jgi:hypothetical protein
MQIISAILSFPTIIFVGRAVMQDLFGVLFLPQTTKLRVFCGFGCFAGLA